MKSDLFVLAWCFWHLLSCLKVAENSRDQTVDVCLSVLLFVCVSVPLCACVQLTCCTDLSSGESWVCCL